MRLDQLDTIREGDSYQVKMDVVIGRVDVLALGMLLWLYDHLGDDATYAEAERVLAEACWWHISLNTLATGHEGDITNGNR